MTEMEKSTATGQSATDGELARKEAIAAAVRQILINIGEDPDREGLGRTPTRIAKMYDEILAGYDTDPRELVNEALFEVEYDEMVVVKDIEFFPTNKVIGLSKIPRIVEMFAQRLQVQERMTRQIADLIDEVLNPHGVAVVVEASHLCSMMRGVKKEHARMITSAMLGTFRKKEKTRNEFLQHLRGPIHGI